MRKSDSARPSPKPEPGRKPTSEPPSERDTPIPRRGIVRSLNYLAPTFRAQVEELLRRMRAEGHDPMVWETWRSKHRAQQLADSGRGILRSTHRLGLAVDIIDRQEKWGASREFWESLGRNAQALGLVWGGYWARADKPHVQAIPVGSQREAWRIYERTSGEPRALIAAMDRWLQGGGVA